MKKNKACMQKVRYFKIKPVCKKLDTLTTPNPHFSSVIFLAIIVNKVPYISFSNINVNTWYPLVKGGNTQIYTNKGGLYSLEEQK